MEFLVAIEVAIPVGADPTEVERRYAAEAVRAHELARVGVLVRLWRVPGRHANWGLWEAADASALHDALTSLPLWPWISATVHPLAVHPNDPASAKGGA
jgi:muconolactone D-isomerase